MKPIYHLNCSACECDKLVRTHYGFLDSHADVVELTPTLEAECLKQFGYTEEKASQEGRLYLCEPYVCKGCGNVDYYNFLKCPDIAKVSRLMIMAVAAPVMCYLFFYTNVNHILSVIMGIIVCIIFIYLNTLFLRRHLRKYDQTSDRLVCKKCSDQDIMLLDCNKEPLKCPECGQMTYYIEADNPF